MNDCPRCQGRREILDPDPYADRRQYIVCPNCGGSGQTFAGRVAALHEWYCRNVMQVRLTPEVERLWFEWLRAGYNGHDLRDVIRYIRKQISLGKRNEGALKLTNLIQRSEAGFIGFDQDLGLSRARANLAVDKRLEPAPDAPAAVAAAPRETGAAPAPAAPAAPAPPAKPGHVDSALKKLREAVE